MKRILFIVAGISSLMFCQLAYAEEEGCRKVTNTASLSLPLELIKEIPEKLNVTSSAKLNLKNDVKLFAVVAAPSWFANKCSMKSGESTSKTLIIWKKDKLGWEEVGRSNKILYGVDTAGSVAIKIVVEESSFRVENSAVSPSRLNWIFSDTYWLNYEVDSNRIRLTKRRSKELNYSKSFDNTLAEIVNEEQSDADGFIGVIYYSLGVGTFEQYEYAKPKSVAKTISISSSPLYLEDVLGVRFKSLPYISLDD